MTVGELIQNLLRFNRDDHVVVNMPGWPVELDTVDKGAMFWKDGDLQLTFDFGDVLDDHGDIPHEAVVILTPGRESADDDGVV